jgi:hypothetical protein
MAKTAMMAAISNNRAAKRKGCIVAAPMRRPSVAKPKEIKDGL